MAASSMVKKGFFRMRPGFAALSGKSMMATKPTIPRATVTMPSYHEGQQGSFRQEPRPTMMKIHLPRMV